MSKGLNLRSVVGGIVKEEAINDLGQTSFLVTFQTSAYEEGHVVWLNRKFESWGEEIKKVPGVLNINRISVAKASQKGGKGVISVGIIVKEAIRGHDAQETLFWANLVSTTRKTLAEIVLRYFSPSFDFKNPLFDALHIHQYVFTPCCSDWETGNKSLRNLVKNPFDLGMLIDDCGAILREPRVVATKNKVFITLRWKQHAIEFQRETLRKVIEAYFKGMGFEIINWEVRRQNNQGAN